MIADLGIIDWLALIVASTLLAAAGAAAVIATVAMRHRRRAALSGPAKHPGALRTRTVARAAPPRSEVIDLRTKTVDASVGAPEARLASRAADLRNRPIPETRRLQAIQDSPRERALALREGRTRGSGFDVRGPGFFDDPMGRHEFRYWDGSRWTEHVKEHGERFIDPL